MNNFNAIIFMFLLYFIFLFEGCVKNYSNEIIKKEIQSWTHHTDKHGKDSTYIYKDTLYSTILPNINLTHSDIMSAIVAYNADTVLNGHNIHVAASKAFRINDKQNDFVPIYLIFLREKDKQIPISFFYSMKYGVMIKMYHPNIYSCRNDLNISDSSCKAIINESCFKNIN